MNIMRIGALLAKYGQLAPADINLEVAHEVVAALGMQVNVDTPLLRTIIGIMQADDIEKLADLASHPALLPKIVAALTTNQGSGEKDEEDGIGHTVCCPHCNEYHTVEIPSIEVPDQAALPFH